MLLINAGLSPQWHARDWHAEGCPLGIRWGAAHPLRFSKSYCFCRQDLLADATVLMGRKFGAICAEHGGFALLSNYICTASARTISGRVGSSKAVAPHYIASKLQIVASYDVR